MPIRDEQTSFSPQINTAEYGHGFTLATARTLQEARVYVDEIPINLSSTTVVAAIYPRGLEQAAGPIRKLLIPVDAVTVTGATLNASGLATGPAILLSPAFGGYYSFDSDHANDMVFLNFNTQEYQVLTNKRILAVNLLLGMHRTTPDPVVPSAVAAPEIGIQDSTNQMGAVVYSAGDEIPTSETTASLGQTGVLRLRFGAQNPFGTSGLNWQHPVDIGRFDSSSASKLYVTIKTGTQFGSPANLLIYLWYAALEVVFCEETRLVYGRGLNNAAQLYPGEPDYGAGVVTLRSVPSGAVLPTLQPGDYTVTIAGSDDGARATPYTAPLELIAERELYSIPTHPGLQLGIPFPPEEFVGREFEATQTHVLPQISLHASGGTLTEPHAYGRQGPAPVYGSVSATQDIYDDLSGVSYPYPQVRFYARKFDTTTVPLKLDSTNVTGTGIAVQITPAEHDLLPEIVDGWKECTLRFPTAPSMGTVSGFPAWRFTSVGEQGGSRWEVLSACAPAISGVPGSLLTQATAVHRLGVATYQPGFGDTVELTWMSPYATGAVVDPDCDAVLIFSQDPPTVTGIAVSQLTQTVTGVGLDCGVPPCCIPTGISYNRITWGLPVNGAVADDDFNRTVAAGSWGTASDGKAWTTSGTAGDFSVTPVGTTPAGSTAPGEGLIAVSVAASDRHAWLDVGGADQDITVSVRMDDVPESGQQRAFVTARLVDASNHYRAELWNLSTGEVQLQLFKNIAGVLTQLGAIVTLYSLKSAQTTPRMLRLQVKGSWLRAKAWDSDQPEPPWWQIVVTDTTYTSGTLAGVGARDNTSTPSTTWHFSGFTVRPPDHAFGGIELQRFDQVTGSFETIMLASSPACTGFNDFEARVGLSSVYRARTVNVYNFAGQWSTTVTGAPPPPGVTGNGTCPDQTGALIFTSNADQTGLRNCAYVMNWESANPTEGFSLPEADAVQNMALYNRDGRVAFHGTERGLEAFSRQLLIAAGSIDPARLADVKMLRDLAWDDLPYVCVRDDIGDRWFSSVRVPIVNAQINRTTYMANVEIIETTRTPAIVDPNA